MVKAPRLRIPEGINSLTAKDYQRYINMDSNTIKNYPELSKYVAQNYNIKKNKGCVELTINNIIEFVILGKKKPKKHYLTTNTIFGREHFIVRKKLVDTCKKVFDEFKGKMSPFKTPISIEFIYSSPKQTFDIDNKLYFWNKIFCDWLKENKLIPDDNVKYIDTVHYKYKKSDLSLQVIIWSFGV